MEFYRLVCFNKVTWNFISMYLGFQKSQIGRLEAKIEISLFALRSGSNAGNTYFSISTSSRPV